MDTCKNIYTDGHASIMLTIFPFSITAGLKAKDNYSQCTLREIKAPLSVNFHLKIILLPKFLSCIFKYTVLQVSPSLTHAA